MMALPKNPVSGGYTLSNPGHDSWWTCPNCHEDHFSLLSGSTVQCNCGAHLHLTIDTMPVCIATCIDPAEDEAA